MDLNLGPEDPPLWSGTERPPRAAKCVRAATVAEGQDLKGKDLHSGLACVTLGVL